MLPRPLARYAAGLAAAIALLLTSVFPAAAQEAKPPAILVQIKSVGEVLDDIQYLANILAGPAGAAQLQAFLQPAFFQGIDQTKPVGLFVQFGEFGEIQMPVVYVPVSKEDDFRATLRTFFTREQQLPNGVVLYQSDDTSIYYKAANGYGFLAMLPTSLEKLPNVAGFPKPQHDVELVINFGQIPQEILTALEAQMQIALAQQQAQQPDAEDRLAQEIVLQTFRTLFQESDRLVIGIDVDRTKGLARLAGRFRPKSNSSLAADVRAMAEATSQFGAMIQPDDIGVVAYAVPIGEQTKQLMQGFFDFIEKEMAKEENPATQDLGAIVLPAIRKALQASDKLDVVVRVVGVDDRLVVIGAAAVPNSNELEEAFLKMARAHATVDEDIAFFRGGSVHRINIPDAPVPLFIAAPEGEFWFAVGEQDAVDAVAQALTVGPRKDLPPIYYALNVKPALELFAAMSNGQPETQARLQELAQLLGDKPGHVRIIARSDGTEYIASIELDEGVLRVLGALAAEAVAQAQQQGAGQLPE